MTRFNNRILFIVLIVLISGFVLSRLFRTPSLESNLEENLLTLDSARITEIRVSPSTDRETEIKLMRAGNTWQVQRGHRTAQAEMSLVKNALGSIREIHPDRVVSRKKEKWGDYNMDSTGTKVKVITGKEVSAEFWVGKTVSGASCVRLEGEDDVYEVKEMLNSYFNKSFSEWRDKSFLRVQTDRVTRISFQYPADSSFVVRQEKTGWMINGLSKRTPLEKADSSKVETYLNKFRSKNLSAFEDDFTPQATPPFIITFNNDSATIATVQAWKMPDEKWVLTSSLQENVYFSSGGSSLIDDLFVGKKTFLSEP